jgi:hypothetical protein
MGFEPWLGMDWYRFMIGMDWYRLMIKLSAAFVTSDRVIGNRESLQVFVPACTPLAASSTLALSPWFVFNATYWHMLTVISDCALKVWTTDAIYLDERIKSN